MVTGKDGFDAVVPRVDWKIESLHTLYSRRCLPAIRSSIGTGAYQVIDFFPEIRIKYIEKEEIMVFDPDFKAFFNVNKQDDLPVDTGFENMAAI